MRGVIMVLRDPGDAGCRPRPLARRPSPFGPFASSCRFPPAARRTSSPACSRKACPNVSDKPVVVENRAGAGGIAGTDMVARAAKDGYTIVLSSAGALSVAASLQPVPYVTARDLRPITLVVRDPELLTVPTSSPAKTLAEFLTLARENPGKLNYGSSGPGSMSNLAGELLKFVGRVDIAHVPYAGAAPALNDLLPGRIQMMFSDIAVLAPHVQAGALRALAIGSKERAPILPGAPTFAEAGLPGVEAENWYGLVAPAGTPDDVVARLNAAAVSALDRPEARKLLLEQSAIPSAGTPEAFGAFIASEARKWGDVVREAGVRSQ